MCSLFLCLKYSKIVNVSVVSPLLYSLRHKVLPGVALGLLVVVAGGVTCGHGVPAVQRIKVSKLNKRRVYSE